MLMMFCITLYQIFIQDLLPYVKLHKHIPLINIHILHKYTSTFLSLIYTFAFIFNKWQNCMYNDTGIVLR